MFNDMLGFSKKDVKYLMTEIDISKEQQEVPEELVDINY